jgi:Polyketide cyclase / dehydrase and lipid transport
MLTTCAILMNSTQVFEHSISINAPIEQVDRTITEQDRMHQWLNPALRCEPIGDWSSEVGSQSRFIIQVPVLKPTLLSTVIERRLGLVVWEFDGFFKGCDRWECFAEANGTRLVNRFEFQIPNPLIDFGFKTFASGLTRQDMQAQLVRLRNVAEKSAPATPSNT